MKLLVYRSNLLELYDKNLDKNTYHLKKNRFNRRIKNALASHKILNPST